MRKAYKLGPAGQSQKKAAKGAKNENPSGNVDNDASVRGEGEDTKDQKEIEMQILGAMALRGAS